MKLNGYKPIGSVDVRCELDGRGSVVFRAPLAEAYSGVDMCRRCV